MKRRDNNMIYTNIFKIEEIEIWKVIFAFGEKDLFFTQNQKAVNHKSELIVLFRCCVLFLILVLF